MSEAIEIQISRLIDISALTPHPRNYRSHPPDQIAHMVQSLTEHGFYLNVVVANDMTILAGHGIIMAASEMGLKQAPVVVQQFGPDHPKALKLLAADNTVSLFAFDDDRQLAELLKEVSIEDELLGTGFDSDDLAALLLATRQDDELEDLLNDGVEPEFDAEPPEEPITKTGDRWILGNHILCCGDSTELKNYPPESSVQLICTDPPYFQKSEEEWDDQWPTGFDGFMQFLSDIFGIWEKLIDDRATIGVFCSADFVWETELKLRDRFNIFNHIVWFKGHGLGRPTALSEMRRFRPRSERILLGQKKHGPSELGSNFNAKTSHIAARDAYKDVIELLINLRDSAGLTNKQIDDATGNQMAAHYFGYSQWALPTSESWEIIATMFAAEGVEPPAHSELVEMRDVRRLEFHIQRREFDALRHKQRSPAETLSNTLDVSISEQRTDVWATQAPLGEDRWGDHTAAKPVDLIAKIISTSSREGDLVLDPFGGSGTTLVASEMLDRNCWMIEMDPKYCDVIVRRWEHHTGKTATLEPGPTATN